MYLVMRRDPCIQLISVKPVVDAKPPPVHPHVRVKPKKLQVNMLLAGA